MNLWECHNSPASFTQDAHHVTWRTKAGVWKNNHQCHVKIFYNKELLFPNKLHCSGMFLLPETEKKKKILFATKLSINTKTFKNRQQQRKTFSVLAIWWQTGLLRGRNRTPRSEFAAALHVCYLGKRNALPGREMLTAIRKSPHNTAVLSIHLEHLLKKKEVPPYKNSQGTKSLAWSGLQNRPQICGSGKFYGEGELTLQMDLRLLISWPRDGEIILDYLGRHNMITRLLESGSGGKNEEVGQSQHQRDKTWERLDQSLLVLRM